MGRALHNLAARIFGTPLLVAAPKLDVILAVLGPRLGLDAAPTPTGPFAAPKERAPLAVEDAIATIQIVGTLANRVDDVQAESGMTGYQTAAAELERALADPAVEGILLEVDSFGGEAAGCFDLADRIAAARDQKRVYGVANQVAMSAGYALLSQCEQVFVPQGGEVGSIGVVSTHVDVSGAAAKEGVRVTYVYAGAHKVDGHPYAALDPATAERMKADVSQIYDTFTAAVARGRGARLTNEGARKTEALTFIGSKAVDAGLADVVGDASAAHAALAARITEDRRMLRELEAAKAANVTLRAKADAAAKKLAVAEATIAQHEKMLGELKAERAAQHKAGLDAVVAEIETKCIAAGATPPTKAERDEIRAALDVSEPIGKKLATAVLERSLARVSTGKKTSLDPAKTSSDEARQKFIDGLMARATPKAAKNQED